MPINNINIPIVTYVHELDMGINQYTRPDFFQNVLSLSTSFIACADSVKNNLVENHGVGTTKIKVLRSLLPESAIGFQSSETKRLNLRNQYNIPTDVFLVGGMGTVDLRKGVDVFLQVADKLKDSKDIFFMWVGGQASEIDYQNFMTYFFTLKMNSFFFIKY